MEVYPGSMFSGKTTALIQRVEKLNYTDIPYKVFQPLINERDENVASRLGFEIEAIKVKDAEGFLSHITDKDLVVAFDEAHFPIPGLCSAVSGLLLLKKNIIIAGLDTDYRGEPFPQMDYFMRHADYVTKMNAVCAVCGGTARRTQRLIDGKPAPYDSPIILVGDKELYEPRCIHHHDVPGKPS